MELFGHQRFQAQEVEKSRVNISKPKLRQVYLAKETHQEPNFTMLQKGVTIEVGEPSHRAASQTQRIVAQAENIAIVDSDENIQPKEGTSSIVPKFFEQQTQQNQTLHVPSQYPENRLTRLPPSNPEHELAVLATIEPLSNVESKSPYQSKLRNTKTVAL